MPEWFGCLHLPSALDFVNDANSMIECATWADWRPSFLIGLQSAFLPLLLIGTLIGVALVARSNRE